ncbi:MAG: 2-oxo acid dehydrogenase subunit E2, partial [Planctomycetes bacterium]|nr:2-oxo acid dehydrogenase subunit E2 [Planctomycetota bacterium]
MHEVLMPKLGQTMEEATVARWLKQEGDTVTRGEVLLEITTDKATLEVESFHSGVLRKIVAPEGAVVPVHRVIAYIGDPNEPIPEVPTPSVQVASEPAPTATTPSPPAAVVEAPTGHARVSPRARRLAQRELVPLTAVRGTGAGGRVVEADVEAYLKRRSSLRVTPTALKLAYERGVDVLRVEGSGRGGKITKADVVAGQPEQVAAVAATLLEPSPMRRIIAQRMSQSKATIPHYYLVMRADVTELEATRRELPRRRGVRISRNDFLLAACARALREMPEVSCRWTQRGIESFPNIDIGVAVALEGGLVVPVLRGVDKLTVTEIARMTRELVGKARAKQLTPDDYAGGAFTVTNLGMYGIDFFIPIIKPGQSAILGVGQVAEEPVVHLGEVAVRKILKLTLSCDHRVIDGAVGARFLEGIRTGLEHPE